MEFQPFRQMRELEKINTRSAVSSEVFLGASRSQLLRLKRIASRDRSYYNLNNNATYVAYGLLFPIHETGVEWLFSPFFELNMFQSKHVETASGPEFKAMIYSRLCSFSPNENWKRNNYVSLVLESTVHYRALYIMASGWQLEVHYSPATHSIRKYTITR